MPWVQWLYLSLLFPVPIRLSPLRGYHCDFHNSVGKSGLKSGPEAIKERLCHGKLEWKDSVFPSKCYIKQGTGFEFAEDTFRDFLARHKVSHWQPWGAEQNAKYFPPPWEICIEGHQIGSPTMEELGKQNCPFFYYSLADVRGRK